MIVDQTTWGCKKLVKIMLLEGQRYVVVDTDELAQAMITWFSDRTDGFLKDYTPEEETELLKDLKKWLNTTYMPRGVLNK